MEKKQDKKLDKKDFLVATEAAVFAGGDEASVLPEDIESYMETAADTTVSVPMGGNPMIDESVVEQEGEEESLSGKKAALFGSVEPSSEDKQTFDWLRMEGATKTAGGDEEGGPAGSEPVLEGEALMAALNESAGKEPASGANARKAALFSSVEASEDVKANFDFERRDESAAAVNEAPVSPATHPLPPPPMEELTADMNKVATDIGQETGVFGAAGGRVMTGKASGDLAKALKLLNAEQIVGLDLWEDGATASFVRYARGRVYITHAGHLTFSEGAGDAERVAELKSFWKGMKFPTRSVWVNVHNASLLQKYVRYEAPVDELEAYLRRDAEESMSGAGGSVVLDWVMSELPGGGGEGILFALPVWEQDHLLSVLRMAGLYVCGVGVAACGLARLYKLMRPGEPGAQCICSLSTTGADIVIAYGMSGLYSRTVYSRAGGWNENLGYLYECLNDAINYFNSWINRSPVASVLICGDVPEVSDFVGELLQETGLLGEVWNPVLDGGLFEMAGPAKKSGVSGRLLAGSLGVALERG